MLVELAPGLRGRVGQLVDHRQAGAATAVAFRAPVTQTHRCEGTFDRIRRAKMNPMCGREVVERQQGITVFAQARHRIGILRLIGSLEQIERLVLPIDGPADTFDQSCHYGLDRCRTIV